MLNTQQLYAMNILKTGLNCFVTGDAGTGKSYLINHFIDESEEEGKSIMVVAPTGISALNIGGVTIHRAFGAPLIPLVGKPEKLPRTLLSTDILIVDEISMCRVDLFDYMIYQIVQANISRRKKGMSDIQIVVVGDFFQLPPVTTDRDKEVLVKYYSNYNKGFAFTSKYWSLCNFKNIVLSDVIRQEDKKHCAILNMARTGDRRCIELITRISTPEKIENAITLCGTNKMANDINESELGKIKSKTVVYTSEIEDEVKESDKHVPDEITLKEGARVMFVVNDAMGSYCNGSFGTVKKLYEDKVGVIVDDTGDFVIVEKFTWNILKYNVTNGILKEEIIGKYTQIPLKLAYAITIHKSQGQTYPAINLEPKSWDCGQLYVAVSRVKSLDRIHLLSNIMNNYLVASNEVIRFYRKLT